jgi:hypothetical protein
MMMHTSKIDMLQGGNDVEDRHHSVHRSRVPSKGGGRSCELHFNNALKNIFLPSPDGKEFSKSLQEGT